MKKSTEQFYELISTEAGAKAITEAMIEKIGVQDFVQCTFFDWPDADQESIISNAIRKAGVA